MKKVFVVAIAIIMMISICGCTVSDSESGKEISLNKAESLDEGSEAENVEEEEHKEAGVGDEKEALKDESLEDEEESLEDEDKEALEEEADAEKDPEDQTQAGKEKKTNKKKTKKNTAGSAVDVLASPQAPIQNAQDAAAIELTPEQLQLLQQQQQADVTAQQAAPAQQATPQPAPADPTVNTGGENAHQESDVVYSMPEHLSEEVGNDRSDNTATTEFE